MGNGKIELRDTIGIGERKCFFFILLMLAEIGSPQNPLFRGRVGGNFLSSSIGKPKFELALDYAL